MCPTSFHVLPILLLLCCCAVSLNYAFGSYGMSAPILSWWWAYACYRVAHTVLCFRYIARATGIYTRAVRRHLWHTSSSAAMWYEFLRERTATKSVCGVYIYATVVWTTRDVQAYSTRRQAYPSVFLRNLSRDSRNACIPLCRSYRIHIHAYMCV